MRAVRARRLTVVALIAVTATGMLSACTLRQSPPTDAGPREWLDAVCPAESTYTRDFDALRQLAELGIDDRLQCAWIGGDGDEETIEVYLLRQDPDEALTNTADSYQSGDGIAPDWLYRQLGDRWAAAFTYDSGRSLEPLEAMGFER